MSHYRDLQQQNQGDNMSHAGRGRSSSNVWVDRRLIASEAFNSLNTAAACQVLMIFLTKRQCAQLGRSGKEQWQITNNGRITFTYQEAERKHHISYGQFKRAIDQLTAKGFIDIVETGRGVYRAANLYSISDRWRYYGTEEYKNPKLPRKGSVNRGFQKGNRYGRNCPKKSPTVIDEHSTTVTDKHSPGQTHSSHVGT